LAITPEVNVDIPIDIKGPKLVPSPWGDAIEIFKKDKSSDSGTVRAKSHYTVLNVVSMVNFISAAKRDGPLQRVL